MKLTKVEIQYILTLIHREIISTDKEYDLILKLRKIENKLKDILK